MSKITFNLDSTSLGSSGCIKDLVLTVIGDLAAPQDGAYRERTMKINLVYGIAVHAFIDAMYKTGGHYPTARKKAEWCLDNIPWIPDAKKLWMNDKKHMLTTCYNTWYDYILEKEPSLNFDLITLPQKCIWCEGTKYVDSVDCPHCNRTGTLTGPATEVNFSLPYYEDDTIIVNLNGTIDRIGKFRGGNYCIPDWKTTGSWDNVGYFEQYELSRQLRFYTFALKLMAQREPESILGKIGATNVGTQIIGIFLKPNANENIVKGSDVMYLSDQMQSFKDLLDAKIQEISFHTRNFLVYGIPLPKQGILTGGCEKKFDKCKFWDVCKSKENIAQILLGRNFIRKVYDPLRFNT